MFPLWPQESGCYLPRPPGPLSLQHLSSEDLEVNKTVLGVPHRDVSYGLGRGDCIPWDLHIEAQVLAAWSPKYWC